MQRMTRQTRRGDTSFPACLHACHATKTSALPRSRHGKLHRGKSPRALCCGNLGSMTSLIARRSLAPGEITMGAWAGQG